MTLGIVQDAPVSRCYVQLGSNLLASRFTDSFSFLLLIGALTGLLYHYLRKIYPVCWHTKDGMETSKILLENLQVTTPITIQTLFSLVVIFMRYIVVHSQVRTNDDRHVIWTVTSVTSAWLTIASESLTSSWTWTWTLERVSPFKFHILTVWPENSRDMIKYDSLSVSIFN